MGSEDVKVTESTNEPTMVATEQDGHPDPERGAHEGARQRGGRSSDRRRRTAPRRRVTRSSGGARAGSGRPGSWSPVAMKWKLTRNTDAHWPSTAVWRPRRRARAARRRPATVTTITRLAAGMIRRTPAGVEGEDRGASGRCPLPEQDTGDHESGDDEEDVHSDEAAPHPGDVGVVEDDQQDGHRPEPLDVGTESAVLRSGTGFVARGLRPGSVVMATGGVPYDHHAPGRSADQALAQASAAESSPSRPPTTRRTACPASGRPRGERRPVRPWPPRLGEEGETRPLMVTSTRCLTGSVITTTSSEAPEFDEGGQAIGDGAASADQVEAAAGPVPGKRDGVILADTVLVPTRSMGIHWLPWVTRWSAVTLKVRWKAWPRSTAIHVVRVYCWTGVGRVVLAVGDVQAVAVPDRRRARRPAPTPGAGSPGAPWRSGDGR